MCLTDKQELFYRAIVMGANGMTGFLLVSCLTVASAQALPQPFLVKDINTMTANSSPASFTPLGNTLFFTAADASSGRRLWRTDGTDAGTQAVANLQDINFGTPDASARPLAVLSGRLVFGADDRVSGNELWSSDGTSAGTELVSDIHPGADASLPAELTLVGDALFFTAEDGVHGRALWKTDGTASGTILVSDFVAGVQGLPAQLTASGNKLFFVIGNDRNAQLWVSDGTRQGTVFLRGAFFGRNLTDVDGTLYFTVSTTLLKSDGSVEGTTELGDFHPVSGQYTPNQLTAVGADLFFLAELGSTGVHLFVTGAHHGTLRGVDKFNPIPLVSAAGKLFFVEDDVEHGKELWTSDGSVEGTQLVRDINPGPAGSDPTSFSPADGRLLFRACDAESCALWESDGTETGTRPLADLAGLAAGGFVTVGSLTFFDAFTFDVGSELWAVSLSAGECIGDCNGDGAVTIAELIRMVRAALDETADARGCVGGADGNGRVTIDDLVAAVAHALAGCQGVTASATPTAPGMPSPTPTNPPGCCVCTTTSAAARTWSFTDCMHAAGCGWFDDACHCGSFCGGSPFP